LDNEDLNTGFALPVVLLLKGLLLALVCNLHVRGCLANPSMLACDALVDDADEIELSWLCIMPGGCRLVQQLQTKEVQQVVVVGWGSPRQK
jgi:hypothetical protein